MPRALRHRIKQAQDYNEKYIKISLFLKAPHWHEDIFWRNRIVCAGFLVVEHSSWSPGKIRITFRRKKHEMPRATTNVLHCSWYCSTWMGFRSCFTQLFKAPFLITKLFILWKLVRYWTSCHRHRISAPSASSRFKF